MKYEWQWFLMKCELPKEECLAGPEVGLSVPALVFLVSFEPPRRAVRSEYLEQLIFLRVWLH